MSLKPEDPDVGYSDPNPEPLVIVDKPVHDERNREPLEKKPVSKPAYRVKDPAMEMPSSSLDADPQRVAVSDERRSTGVRDSDEKESSPLFDANMTKGFQARWNEIQVAFVDEPRSAVERADHLVEEVTQRLADSFADGRRRLEAEWEKGGDASTENLRVALQHYRSFFNRLLTI